jgi:predicted metalloprotease with PDZ domain
MMCALRTANSERRTANRLVHAAMFVLLAASASAQATATQPKPAGASLTALAPVEYTLSFPAPEHRYMVVEARFSNVPAGTLQLRMARTSPGRYALHEFSKNVFGESITDGKGKTLTAARPNLHQWDVTGHDGTVIVKYTVYGDRTDGTYLGVDSMHAHINMPAALMFARGWFDRPARITFVRPAGKSWKVATQLFPTPDPLVYTAPNIHYLMDSPTDFSNLVLRTFTVDDGMKRAGPPPTFRVALTHDGTDADADAFAAEVERIVREAMLVFGELPQFDTNTYTFLSVYLPWANGDGMEHRNSTSLTGAGALRNPRQRAGILGAVSHEFFHAWNMERIRSKGIEPFDFEEADVSDELWLGEGFTNYYDDLILERAGLQSLDELLGDFADIINSVELGPGRRIRSAVEMSRLAPFVDAAVSIDRTTWPNTFISYYTYGSAIGFALDLELRDKTNGRLTLDTYMQALWANYGRPGQKVPGLVATPYTMDGLKAALANVAGDPEFAKDFFARYVEGRELVDYATLLGRAGLVARKRSPGRAWVGATQFQSGGSAARVAAVVPFESPLYNAGVEQDDQVVSLDGTELNTPAALEQILSRHKPGESIPIHYVRRSGETVNGTVKLDEDPRIEIVPIEKAGGTLTAEQKKFRDEWLNSAKRP